MKIDQDMLYIFILNQCQQCYGGPKECIRDLIGVYLFTLMARDVTAAKFVLWRLNVSITK